MSKELTASKLELLNRGWTTWAIRTFLGEPDQRCQNQYPSRPGTCLYLMERVLNAENSQAFLDWRTKTAAKKATRGMRHGVYSTGSYSRCRHALPRR
jgi:hypothetical protein